jgi:hypothetical protein
MGRFSLPASWSSSTTRTCGSLSFPTSLIYIYSRTGQARSPQRAVGSLAKDCQSLALVDSVGRTRGIRLGTGERFREVGETRDAVYDVTFRGVVGKDTVALVSRNGRTVLDGG